MNYLSKKGSFLFKKSSSSLMPKFKFYKAFSTGINTSNSGENNGNNSSSENSSEGKEDLSIFDRKGATKFVIDKVKKNDYFSYISGLVLPEVIKPYYFAYHAFFIELHKSRFASREASINKMRLAFWDDSLTNTLEGKVAKEPMLVLLKDAVENTPIKKEMLYRMIDFQFFDLEKNSEMKSIEELEVYAENTRSLLIYLNLHLLNIKEPVAYEAASHIGRGVGLVDVLKKFPSLAKMHINLLPQELMQKHGVGYLTLWDRHGDISDEFFDCILEVASYAKKHIEVGRSYKDKLPKNTHVAFLSAIEAYDWLLELEKLNFDIFSSSLSKISTYSLPKKIMSIGKQGGY